ncbi:MAG: adenylate/guanylate cyclase domain-containing protein, partial [Gammaproteobacteria bacterium]|nr:adenylate/guanylate cyclase domain-containing protein [Gammaproteobacteria bacterium]
MSGNERSLLKSIVAYIPELIVEQRIVDPHLPDVHGQFHQGTLVFADISGFTTMSEKLSELGKEGAEELNGILNRHFTRMLDITLPHRGAQLKFGGDSMFLLFLGQQHAARAVRCALQMQQAMEEFGQLSTSQGIFRLEMSIGINSGELFAASVGSPRDRLYCIFTGREVNRTAKIEAAANAGEILIGCGTLHELSGNVKVGQGREGYYQVRSLSARLKSILPYEVDLKEGLSESAIEVLASYLPPRLVERLRDNPERAGVEGEHRRVTVMFVNLLGTSAAIEQYGADRVRALTQLLNDYFLMVHAVVNKYEGVLVGCDINTTGDKLLITFGSPVAHEDDDERAVLCAQEIKQLLAGSNLPFKQRIGINSGYVFTGELGSPWRKEYTVMGDQVNVAARLMSVAQEGQILMGHSTYQGVAGKFVLQAQQPVKVKGKSQPVAA